jgi:2,5-dioxopentanoate dehydrogenase
MRIDARVFLSRLYSPLSDQGTPMTISGKLFIGGARVEGPRTFHALSPVTGEPLEPAFQAAERDAVDQACALAWAAFDQFRETDVEVRAALLETIADQIVALGDELLERSRAESGLSLARLAGERGRTVFQLRLFADELRNGGWMGIRIDPPLPGRKPLARPDLRQRKVPVGPVAVFGASNFPLAFSVAGGDTASALAAGCPVVVKGHPAHPGTSELVAQAIASAVEACHLPPGVFSLLNGNSNELGAALVAHRLIKAVGFTGSRAGGMALVKIAAERPEPIPVYAEMSSVNPVLLLPGALAARADKLGEEFVGSLSLGVGQFCTNPGLVIALDGPELERFIASAGAALQGVAPAVMLTPGIHGAYEHGVRKLLEHPKVQATARGPQSTGQHCGRSALFAVSALDVFKNPEVTHEVFGPASVVVRCGDEMQLLQVLEHLEGQLTATLHLTAQDEALAARLLPVLERKAGRLLVNDWPTGVEVSHAMVHGGPFPATSDGRSSSVGTLAIDRFLRPVCYQGFPEALLPASLRRDALRLRPFRLDGRYLTADSAFTMQTPEG